MKTTRTLPSFATACSILFLLGAVALSGCDANELAGPGTAPPETQSVENTEASSPSSAEVTNKRTRTGGGGGTGHGAGHNEVPEESE